MYDPGINLKLSTTFRRGRGKAACQQGIGVVEKLNAPESANQIRSSLGWISAA